jgi:hypothetical protein
VLSSLLPHMLEVLLLRVFEYLYYYTLINQNCYY